MAGLAAEGLKYDKVVGQSADLFTLQVPSNTSKSFGYFFRDFLFMNFHPFLLRDL